MVIFHDVQILFMSDKPTDEELVAAFLAKKGVTVLPAADAGAGRSILGKLVKEIPREGAKRATTVLTIYDFDGRKTVKAQGPVSHMCGLKVGGFYSFPIKVNLEARNKIAFNIVGAPTEEQNSPTLDRDDGWSPDP